MNSSSYKANLYALLTIFMFMVFSCGPASPWESTLNDSRRSLLNSKNLEAIASIEQSLPFTFAIIGDPQGSPGVFKKTVEDLEAHSDVKFLLILGDMTNLGFKHEYLWALDALERSPVPFLVVPGNHDALAFGKELYQEIFGPFDYIFSYAGVRFLMWNNNKLEFLSHPTTGKLLWLEDNLRENDVVVSHIPPAIDVHTRHEIEAWESLYNERKPLVSLHGHRSKSLDLVSGVPVYVTGMVRKGGGAYGLVTIENNKIMGQGYNVSIRSCQRQVCADSL